MFEMEDVPEGCWDGDGEVEELSKKDLKTLHKRWLHENAVMMSRKLIAAGVKYSREDLLAVCAECGVCVYKKGKQRRRRISPKLETQPLETVYADLVKVSFEPGQPLMLVLCLVDGFSGFVDFIRLRSAEASEVSNGLLQYISRYGLPSRLFVDNGSEFSGLTMECMDAMSIEIRKCGGANSPWMNGKAEERNRRLLLMMEIARRVGIKDFDQALALSKFTLNSRVKNGSTHDSTKLFLGINSSEIRNRESLDDDAQNAVALDAMDGSYMECL